MEEPFYWKANHDPAAYPDKNQDWYSWHISIHPFVDMFTLYEGGDITAEMAKDLFDLSTSELAQMSEIYVNFISSDANHDINIMRLQGLLRAHERGMVAQFTDPQTFLYNKLGITTADDR
jgi:hypothetical protein